MRIYIEQEDKFTIDGLSTIYYVMVAEENKLGKNCLAATTDYSKAEKVYNQAIADYKPVTSKIIKEVVL